MKLEGKVALITGAASGIGRQTALLFSEEGAVVVVVDVNDIEGEVTVSLIEDRGGEAIYTHADVSKADHCESMVQVAEQQCGKLDVMFNNAGIMHGRDGDAMTTDEDV